jgi:hypothetical protein
MPVGRVCTTIYYSMISGGVTRTTVMGLTPWAIWYSYYLRGYLLSGYLPLIWKAHAVESCPLSLVRMGVQVPERKKLLLLQYEMQRCHRLASASSRRKNVGRRSLSISTRVRRLIHRRWRYLCLHVTCSLPNKIVLTANM